MNEAKTFDEALGLLRYDFRKWRDPHEQSVLYSILGMTLLVSCLVAAAFSCYHLYNGSLNTGEALHAFIHLSLYTPLGIASLITLLAGISIAFTRDLGKWRLLCAIPLLVVAVVQALLYLLAPDIYRHLL